MSSPLIRMLIVFAPVACGAEDLKIGHLMQASFGDWKNVIDMESVQTSTLNSLLACGTFILLSGEKCADIFGGYLSCATTDLDAALVRRQAELGSVFSAVVISLAYDSMQFSGALQIGSVAFFSAFAAQLPAFLFGKLGARFWRILTNPFGAFPSNVFGCAFFAWASPSIRSLLPFWETFQWLRLLAFPAILHPWRVRFKGHGELQESSLCWAVANSESTMARSYFIPHSLHLGDLA